MTVDGIMVESELHLGCDVPCGDDGQERDLASMHHVVVKDKWKLGAKGPEEYGRSHGRPTWCTIRAKVHEERNGDEDGVGQIKKEGDGKLE